MVFVLALGLGLVTVLDVPARQAFITEMVGPDDYVNAQSLNSTVHNAGRLIGPAVAGLLIAWVGSGAAFAINAVSFVAVLISLFRIDPYQLTGPSRCPAQRGQALEGLRYVWGRADLRACLMLVAVLALFGQNFRVVLPLFARDVFGGGAETYGWLTSALGAGAVIGALATAARETVSPPGRCCWRPAAFGVVSVLLAGAPGSGRGARAAGRPGHREHLLQHPRPGTAATGRRPVDAGPGHRTARHRLHRQHADRRTDDRLGLRALRRPDRHARQRPRAAAVALVLLPTLRRVRRREDAAVPAPSVP